MPVCPFAAVGLNWDARLDPLLWRARSRGEEKFPSLFFRDAGWRRIARRAEGQGRKLLFFAPSPSRTRFPLFFLAVGLKTPAFCFDPRKSCQSRRSSRVAANPNASGNKAVWDRGAARAETRGSVRKKMAQAGRWAAEHGPALRGARSPAAVFGRAQRAKKSPAHNPPGFSEVFWQSRRPKAGRPGRILDLRNDSAAPGESCFGL